MARKLLYLEAARIPVTGGHTDEEDANHRRHDGAGRGPGGLRVVGSHTGYRDLGDGDLGDSGPGHNLVETASPWRSVPPGASVGAGLDPEATVNTRPPGQVRLMTAQG